MKYMRTRRIRTLGAIFSFVVSVSLSIFPASVSASFGTDGAPTSPNSNIFTSSNSTARVDGETGALTDSVPLDIPPGRNGLQPNLSLEYNSQNTDKSSIVGYGWSLSIPYIARLNKTGSQDLYASSTYFTSSADGELVRTQSTTNYLPRVDDGSYHAYTYATSTNSWTMYDKSGTRYTFGASDQGRQFATSTGSTNTYKWMLEEGGIVYAYFDNLKEKQSYTPLQMVEEKIASMGDK